MSEAITLICVIAIVGPFLALLVMAYNINRRLKGFPEKEGDQALMDIWRDLIKGFQGNKDTSAQAKSSKKKVVSRKEKESGNVEDAEFYEKPKA